MRHGSASAIVVVLAALVSLAGCTLLSPPAPRPGAQPKPATKTTAAAAKPAPAARPAALAVRATNASGGAMDNVLVLLHPLDARPDLDDAPAVLDVLDRRFEPAVLPVRVGGSVLLKNLDGVPHDVYSFSKARPLSLHLAAGDRGKTVKFSRAGVVTVGCKVYNDMRGYIYVTDAAYFGTTDGNGFLRLSGIAPGSYRVEVWRADQPAADPPSFPEKIELEPGAERALPVKFPASPSRTQPKPGRH